MANKSAFLYNIRSLPLLANRYKYLLVLILYISYMLFFDQYKLPTVFTLSSNVSELQNEKINFERLIVQAKEDKVDIEKNYEKFAREKYYMSKQDEDVFIIERRSLKKK